MISFLVLSSAVLVASQTTSGADAVARAQQWADARLQYCQAANGEPDQDSSCSSTCNRQSNSAWDAYRSDCSGLVSWAWGLSPPGETTSSLGDVSSEVDCSTLQPGDACNIAGHHVVLFASWISQGSSANFIEEPGCSGSITYAHDFTSDVQISGSSITLSYSGQTFTCIRSNSIAGGMASSSSNSNGGSNTNGNGMNGAMSNMGSMSNGGMSNMGGQSNGGQSNGGQSNGQSNTGGNAGSMSNGGQSSNGQGAGGGLFGGSSNGQGGSNGGQGGSNGGQGGSNGGQGGSNGGQGGSNGGQGASGSGGLAGGLGGLLNGAGGSGLSGLLSGASGSGLFGGLFGGGAGAPPASSTGAGLLSGLLGAATGSGSTSSTGSSGLGSLLSFLDQKPVVYGPCGGGVNGTCQDVSLWCPNQYQSFLCGSAPGVVACCPTSPPASQASSIVVPGIPRDTHICGRLTFPLASDSLHHIGVNYGGARANGSQCHEGIDLFTTGSKKVLAMADGVVSYIVQSQTPCTCTGKSVRAASIFIVHQTVLNIATVVYGQINASTVSVRPGDNVTRGQVIGIADVCCLLHFEMWQGTAVVNGSAVWRPWLPVNNSVVQDPDWCARNSMSTKPAQLLDPRPMINCLKPPSATIVADAGVGGEYVLPPPAVSALNATSAPSVGSKSAAAKPGLSGGLVTLIVIVVVVVLAAIGVAVVCVVRGRLRDESADSLRELRVENPLHEQVGEFTCATCGAQYRYASDLTKHTTMRHP